MLQEVCKYNAVWSFKVKREFKLLSLIQNTRIVKEKISRQSQGSDTTLVTFLYTTDTWMLLPTAQLHQAQNKNFFLS